MRTISIKTIPHEKQRYNTTGDYESSAEETVISISQMRNEQFEFLVAIHELVESFLCQQAGITDAAIDAFDFDFAAKRAPNDAAEPGDESVAPYHAQHEFAKRIERLVAEELGVDWEAYDACTSALMKARGND